MSFPEVLTFKGGWGDGTEGEAGNLEGGKGPVAEKVPSSAGVVVVVVFKGRKVDKIRFQDFYRPPPA